MERALNNRKRVRRLLLVVFVMFGFGYALVPLYDAICDVTGLNGKTGRASPVQAQNAAVDREREITVEFVSSINGDLPWEFKPYINRLRMHPGESRRVDFYARNQSDTAITARAVPSVAPNRGSRYFNKIECFCFTEQELAAGEEKEMPVRFVVSPDLPSDIKTITLSYTFFAVEPKQITASGAPARAGGSPGSSKALSSTLPKETQRNNADVRNEI